MSTTDSQTTDNRVSLAGFSPVIAECTARLKAATAVALFILTVVPVLVFLQLGNCAFIQYDDPDYVWFEPLVTNGLSFSGLYQSVTTYRNSNWHPATWWSLALDYALFGRNPRAFHLHSLVLHILNGWLLFLWLRKGVLPVGPSLLVALLFSIHPLHVEPVAWVSSRKDVLSTFFFLWMLNAYEAYAHRPGRVRYLLVALLYGLGLMSKSMLVTAPLLMLLIDLCILHRWSWRRRGAIASQPVAEVNQLGQSATDRPACSAIFLILEKLSFAFMAAGTSILCYQAQHGFGAVVDSSQRPVLETLSQIATSYSFYIEKTFVPLNLTLHYPRVAAQSAGRLAMAALVLITATWFAFRPGRNRLLRMFGGLWFLVSLLPVCGIIRLGDLSTADRYSYIPLIGLFITVVASIPLDSFDVPWLRRLSTASMMTACGVLALLAHKQVGYWRNSETVFRHAHDVVPNCARIEGHLGMALERRGNLDEAAAHLRESIRLFQDDIASRCILCKILTAQKDYAGALAIIEDASKTDWKVAQRSRTQFLTNGERRTRSGIYHLWGRALEAAGKHPEAIQKFIESRSIDDSLPLLHADLAEALQAAGQFQAATEACRKCTELDPGNRKWKEMLASLTSACPETNSAKSRPQ